MWQGLAIAHRKKNEMPDWQESPLLWNTCLRQILFIEPFALPPSGGQVYHGSSAYQFLVEICAGLHSPLLGETEVFGQFRNFRQTREWPQEWESLLDAVEEDARKVRREHLTRLGSQSYGSLMRKRLRAEKPVVLVGGGQLAQELLPWLKERPLFVLLRNPQKLANALSLDQAEGLPLDADWVIAAPISNEKLSELMQAHKPGQILDFRGKGLLAPRPANYFDLSSFFAELTETRNSLEGRRQEALAYASSLASRREAQVVHRPFGWEDAFA